MTNPYPPQPPRKLVRSRNNRVLGGVCGGAAEYVNMDPTLVRVLTVLVTLFTGVPLIVYLIALFLIPEEEPDHGQHSAPPVTGGWTYDSYPQYPQYPQQAGQPGSEQSPYLPSPQSPSMPQQYTGSHSGDDAMWGQEGAPWEQRQHRTPDQDRPPQQGDQRF